MKNKKGQVGMIVLIIMGIIGLTFAGFAVFGADKVTTTQVAVGTPSIQGTGCADSTGVLTVSSTSALTGGTAPTTPTITAGVNEGSVTTSVTSGTTTFPVGANVEVLVSDTDSIDKSFSFVMPCGGMTLEAPLYYSSSDNPGIRMKNDDGDFMTNAIAGGATNQTDLTAGETLVLDVEFQGTNTEASGDGIWVIELPASSSANVSSINVAGLTSVPVPSIYSANNAGSKLAAFKVPNVIGADKKSYAVSIALTSAKDLSGAVYTTWYTEQEFVDDDNSISVGVEDSDGTAKHENSVTFYFYVNAA